MPPKKARFEKNQPKISFSRPQRRKILGQKMKRTQVQTVTRQTGEYKVDLTYHPKFPFAFEEITIAFEVDGPSAHHQ
jgi:hypothetical protein